MVHRKRLYQAIIICLLMHLASCEDAAKQFRYFEIHVVDSQTGRGIPGIELETLARTVYITDSQGYIAFFEPGLMEEEVYFIIRGEGYRHPKDASGRMSVTLRTDPGGASTVSLTRIQAAERLYRCTGLGIYKDSYLLGKAFPIDNPIRNARVLGQDSNIGIRYKGRLFWVWGDSFLPSRYEGNFSVSGATSEFPGNGGLDPGIGVNYHYFEDSTGASKAMINIGGPGYTWFEWLMNIPGKNGEEQLVAKYARVGGLFQNYERGIAVFNDSLEVFEKYADAGDWLDGYAIMHHPFKAHSQGGLHYYTTSEFEMTRVALHLDSVSDPSAYQSFTCLKSGTRFNPDDPQLDRDAGGRLQYGWKVNTDPITPDHQAQLIEKGWMHESEGWMLLRDIVSGKKLHVRRGSVYWNQFRNRWILIAGLGGEFQGEVVYAEADTPVGPWGYGRIVAVHDNLFYNPTQHVFFDQDTGRTVFFEGTYTNFWGQGETKPYYDYNQMMYRLNLSNEDAMLPAPVYRMNNSDLMFKEDVETAGIWDSISSIAFFAFRPDHHPGGLVPVFKEFAGGVCGLALSGEGVPFMYAMTAGTDSQVHFHGRWDVSLTSHEAIDSYLPLVVGQKDSTLQASTGSRTFSVSAIRHSEDELFMVIEQYGNAYELRGKMVRGQLAGTWSSVSKEYSGEWTGEYTGLARWLPSFSPDLAAVSSAAGIIESSGAARRPNEDVVCRVWQNRYKHVVLDPAITPVD